MLRWVFNIKFFLHIFKFKNKFFTIHFIRLIFLLHNNLTKSLQKAKKRNHSNSFFKRACIVSSKQKASQLSFTKATKATTNFPPRKSFFSFSHLSHFHFPRFSRIDCRAWKSLKGINVEDDGRNFIRFHCYRHTIHNSRGGRCMHGLKGNYRPWNIFSLFLSLEFVQ